MQHEAFFENAPLHEILYQLERWYSVRFVLENESMASEQLTLHVQSQSFEDGPCCMDHPEEYLIIGFFNAGGSPNAT